MKMLKSDQISNPFLKACLTLQSITHNSSIVFVPFRARSALPSICGPRAVSLLCILLFHIKLFLILSTVQSFADTAFLHIKFLTMLSFFFSGALLKEVI